MVYNNLTQGMKDKKKIFEANMSSSLAVIGTCCHKFESSTPLVVLEKEKYIFEGKMSYL